MAIDAEYLNRPQYEYSLLPGPGEKIKRKNGRPTTISPSGCIRLLTIEPSVAVPKTKTAVTTPKHKTIGGWAYNVGTIKRHKPDLSNSRDIPGQLMCRLDMYDKDYAPDYDALSWVWGDNQAPKSKSVRIWSNGKVPLAKEMKITEQLEKALKNLRQKNTRRVVWVDALCLDQRNGKEREREMGMMDVIYSRAKLVLIWLGESADQSQLVPAFIRKILSKNLEGVEELVGSIDNVKNWGALAALMRREWFTRRWCVQEVAMAQQAVLQFGKSKIPWQDFADAVRLLEDWRDDIERLLVRHHLRRVEARMGDHIDIAAPGAQGLVGLLGQFFRRESGNLERLASIETLLCALSAYNVTVPQDAVYALLKLGKDTCNMRKGEDIQPNYGITTIEAYKDFIEKVIKKSRSLDIICIPWAPLPKDDEMEFILPSWIVPTTRRAYDRRQRDDAASNFRRVHADCLVGYMGKKPYNASGPLLRNFAPQVRGKNDKRKHLSRFHILEVKGRIIGEIAELGGAARDGNVPLSWLDMAIASMKKKAQKAAKAGVKVNYQDFEDEEDSALAGSSETILKKRGRGGPHIPEAFWRTLVADRGPRGIGPPGWYRRVCQRYFARNANSDELLTGKEVHAAMIKPRMNRPAIEFLRRVQAAAWNKKFMITVGGKFGLVPEESQKLDSLCLIYGCSVPVVMRAKGDCWLLVGECYIHGIMNGEYLEKLPGIRTEPDSRKTAKGARPKIGNAIFKII